MNANREVVITGTGIVSPIGVGVDSFWEALMAGTSGVGVRPYFDDVEIPHRIAAEVKDFDPKQFVRPRKALKLMCGPIQFGCAAAMMAFDNSGLTSPAVDPDRLGIVFGTETFFADPNEVADVFQKCTVNKDYQHDRWGEFAMREIQPLWMLKYLPNMAASHISIALDARGPSNSICQGEVSGLLALIEAADLIRRGTVNVVVAGSTGSQLALTATLYRGSEMLSKRIDHPEQASRPFDADRDGMVVGEGAGAVVLESAEHAAARGAKVLARLAGWSRGYHRSGDPGFSDTLAYHFQHALQRSSLTAGDIDLVNANADGSRLNDAIEAEAIRDVFADTPVVAHKGNFGNLGPGTSCVELVAAVQSIERNQLPGTLNCDRVGDDCRVNVVQEAQSRDASNPINHIMKSSFSATGQMAAMVVSR